MSLTTKDFKEFAVIAAQAADAKQGENIVLLDLTKTQVGLCDYILIVSANSETHLYTLCEEIKDQLKKYHLTVMHREGGRNARWSVLDYGGFMVHALHQEMRALYAIDRLWEDAKEVVWQQKSEPKIAAKKTVKKKAVAKKAVKKTTQKAAAKKVKKLAGKTTAKKKAVKSRSAKK